MEEIIVFWRELEPHRRLTVERNLNVSASFGRALFKGEQQGSQRHDRRLGGAPSAGGILMSGDVAQGLARECGSFAGLEQSLDGKTGGLNRRAGAAAIDGGFVRRPPDLIVLFLPRIQQLL